MRQCLFDTAHSYLSTSLHDEQYAPDGAYCLGLLVPTLHHSHQGCAGNCAEDTAPATVHDSTDTRPKSRKEKRPLALAAIYSVGREGYDHHLHLAGGEKKPRNERDL